MAGLFFNGEGYETAARGWGNVGASAFTIGDPLVVSANLLIPAPQDTSELLITDGVVGFSLEPSTGIRAASRPADSATPALAAGMNGPRQRSYVTVDAPGLTMWTRNFWATGDPTTRVVPATTDIGVTYQITAQNAANVWGVEQTAGVPGVNVCARVIDVVNDNWHSIAADQPGEGTAGTILIFRVVGA